MYSINVFKQYLNFSASHFIIFNNGNREPLHGHNYSIHFKLHSSTLNADMVLNFLDVKPLLKRICDSLDHRLLLPRENSFFKIEDDPQNNKNYVLKIVSKENIYDQFSIPKKDILILPISNISVECLSYYLLHKIQRK
ncbi:MAG: 6-carboxytetrahydropterin synthase [Oligoflexia bacterium]|nr:6-carboxytetrahydropterin synthase [Oligoflexia bacterium]